MCRSTKDNNGYVNLATVVSLRESEPELEEDKEDVLPPLRCVNGADPSCTPPAPDDLEVVDSRVSISLLPEEHCSSEHYDGWLAYHEKSSPAISPMPQPRMSSAHLPIEAGSTVRSVKNFSSPIRPRAKTPAPPTPIPGSAVSMADSYRSDLTNHLAVRSLETGAALSSHPVRQTETLTALPQISLPKEEFPVKHPAPGREVEIKHPSPRRFASHPVLLQRASSIASSLYPRSFSDSPGPPPPRSPLRLRQDPRTIESIIATHNITHVRESTPRIAPMIEPVLEYNDVLESMKPCVVTECTGPIKRPRSRGEKSSMMIQRAHPISRREREDRIKSRKLRDKPTLERAIDTLVHTSSQAPAKRLRKARPQINIPDLHVAPLVTRASSSASSNASWKKISECTRSPVSPVPSQGTPTSSGEKTGYTPISPTASNESAMTALTRMALSPVMLVAEEIPLQKSRPTPKPARLIVKDSKLYAPRPRSASIPHNSLKRQSRASGPPSGVQTPVTQTSRPNSPSQAGKDDTPPLPSPPPNRALPPTPPASGSERSAKMCKKDLPTLPAYEILSKDSTPPNRIDHVATQAQRKSVSSKESSNSKPSNGKDTSKFDARLAALEKQNAMLSAALMAVLRTNGTLNSPLAAIAPVSEEPESPKQMQWETRIARRSAASQQHSSSLDASAGACHAASSSEGSALEMYIATRRGSRHGCGGG
ncbi:hypothetical protein LTR78_008608 [Recurvomyces mirabilis]|uniref:Uncharacterized protein n=1 Tax=Recurvomyces mirabilis TaxID=574656 RepID=A0AAE0TPR0_9PEZI|nr:hypothetical protein LTR78_008608 [Recurvomyces mirabilis]KAK5153480.1 hypothetical protein LTS14_007651 [Recurvomyces mirabilis]